MEAWMLTCLSGEMCPQSYNTILRHRHAHCIHHAQANILKGILRALKACVCHQFSILLFTLHNVYYSQPRPPKTLSLDCTHRPNVQTIQQHCNAHHHAPRPSLL